MRANSKANRLGNIEGKIKTAGRKLPPAEKKGKKKKRHKKNPGHGGANEKEPMLDKKVGGGTNDRLNKQRKKITTGLVKTREAGGKTRLIVQILQKRDHSAKPKESTPP